MELVEPEAVTVKEEKVEPNGSEEEKAEPDVQLIGDDGEYAIRKFRKKKKIRHIQALKVLFFFFIKVWWTVSLLELQDPSWNIRTASPLPASSRACPGLKAGG